MCTYSTANEPPWLQRSLRLRVACHGGVYVHKARGALVVDQKGSASLAPVGRVADIDDEALTCCRTGILEPRSCMVIEVTGTAGYQMLSHCLLQSAVG